MRRAVVFLAVLLALSLAACGGSREYKGSEHTHDQWEVEWERCLWDVTHKRQDDGSFIEIEVPEDKLEKLAHQCMEKKGYKLKTAEDEKKEGGWLWW